MRGRSVVVCDLDGVVWLGDQPVAGVGEAIGELRGGGLDVLFMTNNSSLTVSEIRSKLARAGIDAEASDISGSAGAAALVLARTLDTGARVLACAGDGVLEALDAGGLEAVQDGPCEAVVVGWHRSFDFEGMARAGEAVRSGALFVATNLDATYPTSDGLLPGNGALVAAVAAAGGRRPDVVAGKPEPPMVEMVRSWAGARYGVVIGDRPSTDGCLAEALGWPFVLISSEVTSIEPVSGGPVAAISADSLADAVEGTLALLRPAPSS